MGLRSDDVKRRKAAGPGCGGPWLSSQPSLRPRQHVTRPLPMAPARQTMRFQANRAKRKLSDSEARETDTSVANCLRTGVGLEGAHPGRATGGRAGSNVGDPARPRAGPGGLLPPTTSAWASTAGRSSSYPRPATAAAFLGALRTDRRAAPAGRRDSENGAWNDTRRPRENSIAAPITR
jgi:hypothetical protein